MEVEFMFAKGLFLRLQLKVLLLEGIGIGQTLLLLWVLLCNLADVAVPLQASARGHEEAS